MTDKNNPCLQEAYDDAALALLMNEYAEIEGESLWREFQAVQAAGNDPETSEREDRKPSRRSITQNRQTDFLKFIGNGLQHAAVIFLVLICFLSPLVISVEAFKLPVMNYFVAVEEKFFGFQFGKHEELHSEQDALIDLIMAAPWPEGYYLSKQQTSSNGKIWIDLTCEGRAAMRISVYPSAGRVNIDTEDVTQIPMEIQGCKAIYLQKDGHRIMWMDAERQLLFTVHAFELEKDTFLSYISNLIAYLSE